ncbi:MAG TPA: sulfate adenylyltransferase subunit CysD [Candidatus Binatia bacterium]|nr:sulfate adenylyltransferase subunit CysD [Candidatus Binatia bacterium]
MRPPSPPDGETRVRPEGYALSVLRTLEAESLHILREVASECERPVMMYSVGKDSSTMLRLAQKAFYPAPIPFPLLHIDTSYKFPEMYEFRDRICREVGVDLRVYRNDDAIAANANPFDLGTVTCCGLLKTQGLLGGLRLGEYDAVIGGARREEERSRAKERVYSFRDRHGQWDPKNQRPELWSLYNGKVFPGESIRVFPLSNWTELDIWRYIELENIPVVPLYFAAERAVVVRGRQFIPVGVNTRMRAGERAQTIMCRFRTLGCYPCTGAVPSSARTVREIIEELEHVRHSERITRVIDHDQDGSMEQKKREGYF